MSEGQGTPFASQAPQDQSGGINLGEMVSQMQKMYSEIRSLQSQLHASNSSTPVSRKSFYNKPTSFTGKPEESIESFIGHVDLYLGQVPQDQKLGVAVSYLSGDAYNWFQVMQNISTVQTWEELKRFLQQRFSPINKIKSARDKLAVCRQSDTVANFNENFLKIIMDIPKITSEESIDRYLRGLKKYIGTRICTKDYEKLDEIMADAMKIEASAGSFFKFRPPSISSPFPLGSGTTNAPVPMDISQLSAERVKQRAVDMSDNTCYYCHQSGCRIANCPQRIAANKRKGVGITNVDVDTKFVQEKDQPAHDT